MIKPCWGELILSGIKTIEVRRGRCSKHLGERVALAYSGTATIYGHVNVVACMPLGGAHAWQARREEHRVPCDAPPYGRNTWGWVLANAARCEPLRVTRTPGAVIWQSL